MHADLDFWKTPSQRICAVLQSDYDSLKCYLDSIRETAPIKRKRASSATASSTAIGYGLLQPLSSSTRASSPDMDIFFKIDGEVEDALAHLGRLESSFERVHERLENIEDKMEQVTRHRLPSKRRTKSKAATIAARMMPCKICHLLSRSPIAVSICCRQWLGCERCTSQCGRCSLCNATWSDEKRPLSLRGFDDMRALKKEMRNELGSDVAHDDSSSDTELPIVLPSATTQGAGVSSSRSLTADVNVRADSESPEIIE